MPVNQIKPETQEPDMINQPFFVTITFKRIQTFLFAVPRLRAMLGANVLLGEVLRNELSEIALACGSNKRSLDYSYAQSNIAIGDPLD